MLLVATAIFLYYTTWTLLMVRLPCLGIIAFLQHLLIFLFASPSSTRVTLSTISSLPVSGPSVSPFSLLCSVPPWLARS